MKKFVTLGELLLRLTPQTEPLYKTDALSVCYGGSEANVAVALAGFGETSVFLTALPASDLGRAAEQSLLRYGVDARTVKGEGRLGLYFYEKGVSLRAGKIVYDRKNSVFAETPASAYDFSVLDGAAFLHLSGITPALGENARALTFRALSYAREKGVPVSFDLNFRSNLWTEEEARRTFLEIIPFADVLIASSDGLDILGMENASRDLTACVRAAEALKTRFPLKVVALTVRESVSASFNRLGAVLYSDRAYFSPQFGVDIVDRVGGGDAFAAGLLYALAEDFGGEEAVRFAAACNAYKHTLAGDNFCVPPEEILAVLRGDTRLRR